MSPETSRSWGTVVCLGPLRPVGLGRPCVCKCLGKPLGDPLIIERLLCLGTKVLVTKWELPAAILAQAPGLRLTHELLLCIPA